VPFAPETKLSGIGDTGFRPFVWYRKSVTLPTTFQGDNTLSHFGTVDYSATVWDQPTDRAQPRGKQYWQAKSRGILTRELLESGNPFGWRPADTCAFNCSLYDHEQRRIAEDDGAIQQKCGRARIRGDHLSGREGSFLDNG
jgi:hypothetical protein